MTQPHTGWRPKVFDDHELDLAIKTIYDQHYMLTRTSLNTLFNGETISRGKVNVKGSLTLNTGLSQVTNVVATINGGKAGFAEILSCRPTPQKAGYIDIFIWTTASAPSVTTREVLWQATGQA